MPKFYLVVERRSLGLEMRRSSDHALSDEVVRRLFGVLFAELRTISLTEARTVVASAGVMGDGAPQYWDPFLAGVERAFDRLESEARFAALRILGDRFSTSERVGELFAKHGFEYIDGTFVPVALLDQREALYLPTSSASELAKAMKRLVEGDETGAITSACGAVDGLMQQLYKANSIGDPKKVAFAAKVNTALQRLGIFAKLEADLVSVGLSVEDARNVIADLTKGTNHAAQLLQTLRTRMGDVHGSKPALRRTAYDAIKWASAICGLFDR